MLLVPLLLLPANKHPGQEEQTRLTEQHLLPVASQYLLLQQLLQLLLLLQALLLLPLLLLPAMGPPGQKQQHLNESFLRPSQSLQLNKHLFSCQGLGTVSIIITNVVDLLGADGHRQAAI